MHIYGKEPFKYYAMPMGVGGCMPKCYGELRGQGGVFNSAK